MQRLLHPLTSGTTASKIWCRVRVQMGLEDDLEFLLSSFRNTFASALANAGANSFLLQKAMGHKCIVSTQRCVSVSTEALKGLESIIEERTNNHKLLAA